MKILQIITSLRIGGAEKLITDMAPLFIEKGHTVDVLLFDGIETSFKQQLLNQNIKIISLGVNTFVYNPLLILKLIPIIKQYDIVHTHNTACQYFVAIASKFLNHKNIKLITTEHNTTNRRRNICWLKPIEKWMYKQYNSIICISDKAKENLQEYIGSNYPIKTIYNGIDIQKFTHATPLNRDSLGLKDNFIICMVAGFRPQKDQDTLIRAMKRLPNNFHLWLIGDGERRKELEILTQKEELTNRVKFWGIRSDIPQLLKTADIIVMSSHWEGLSLSSLEGMSSGKPFIASDVDGLHEVVNRYGILFPEGNDKVLSKIVLQLVQDKSLYTNIAEKCQKRAEEYDLQKTINSYLSIYQNTVS